MPSCCAVCKVIMIFIVDNTLEMCAAVAYDGCPCDQVWIKPEGSNWASGRFLKFVLFCFLHSLKLTANAPEKRSSRMENSMNQPSIFRCELLVSGSVTFQHLLELCCSELPCIDRCEWLLYIIRTHIHTCTICTYAYLHNNIFEIQKWLKYVCLSMSGKWAV